MKLKFIDFNIDLEILEPVGLDSQCIIKQIEEGYVIKRKIINTSRKVVRLKELKAELSNIRFGGVSESDYFYANENARLFGNLTIPIDYNRADDNAEENKKFGVKVDRSLVDPGVQDGRILSSPYQPFPAILLSNYCSNKGIVCGSLLQDVFYHNFETGHCAGKCFLTIYSSFKGIDYREIKPSAEIEDIFYVGEIDCADDVNKIFDKYTAVLRRYIKKETGAKDTNRHTLIWDSWNDGIYRDISEEMLLKEAVAVKELIPNVEWFQVDDGYSQYCESNVDSGAHGLGVPYEGLNGIDYKKFPNGLKSYTDKVKEIGLKPAIWIGGLCPAKTKIHLERPEWFIDYSLRTNGGCNPLDVSIKEVREYMSYAVRQLITEYGFEGVKHDFWSYAFEDRHNILKNKDKSGYEYRKWWIATLRKCLPEYGYAEACCDIGMGNPFLGEYFNNYRFGDDIGGGSWQSILTTYSWAVAALSTHTGDLFVPNSDSIGLLPKLNDTDFMFIVNFQIITRSIVEISGRFSKVDSNNERLKILKRAVRYLNNGESVYFAKFDYRKDFRPNVIYINSAFDEPNSEYITVGVFNPEETEKTICFDNLDVGLSAGEHKVEYVWENAIKEQADYTYKLFPHQSILLKIEKARLNK